MVPIPVGLTSAEFAENGGCSRLVAEKRSELECGRACGEEPMDSCVSFYFHEARRQCRLVLYTDATIDMSDAQGWKKFVKKMR